MKFDRLSACWILTVLFLGGCATQGDFVEQSVTANISVEEAHNKILFLNVLRGYKRQPMHFTGFQSIKGPLGVGSPTLGFKIPFGPDFRTNIYEFSPSLKPDSAQFDVAIYDKQEFVRGFTTPVSPKILQYYVDQGWPAALILHMFVREVVFTDEESKEYKRLVNQPQNKSHFEDFTAWISDVARCGFELKIDEDKTTFGLPIDMTEAKKLDIQMKMKAEKITIVTEKNKETKLDEFRLAKITEKFAFGIKGREGCKVESGKKTEGGAAVDIKTLGVGTPSSDKDTGVAVEKKEGIALFLRSPEAMVFYLGELVGAQIDGVYDENGKVIEKKIVGIPTSYPKDQEKPGMEPLFVVTTISRDEERNSALFVQYAGETYAIPSRKDKGGRSMHALSLVSQIIGMQKNATELPQSTTVRITQ